MEQLKVLLIEDDDLTRRELGEFLTKEAFDVIRAGDGNEGRILFERESPDIVITDLRMPGLSGLQVMEVINEQRPEVPVILTTAFCETDVALKALRLGALDCIKKPIDLEELMMALERARKRVMHHRQLEEIPSVLIVEDEIRIGLFADMVQHTKAFATNILDHISDGVIVVDKEMNVVFMNKTVSDILESEPKAITEEVASKLFGALGRRLDLSDLRSALESAFEGDPGVITGIGNEGVQKAVATKVCLKVNDLQNEYVVIIVHG